jgi:lipoprotein-anchoring transpeptidase ErfK/SrfK
MVAVDRRASVVRRVAVLVAVAVVATGCTAGRKPRSDGAVVAGPSGTVAPARPPVKVDVTVDGKRQPRQAPLDAVVAVTAVDGKILSVSVRSAKTAAVPGRLAADGSRWLSTATLAPGTKYQVTVQAAGDDGRKVKTTSAFTTLRPKAEVRARITPLNGDVVGVGHPIGIYFTAPVTDRAAVEKRLKVTTSKSVEGAWHWFSDTEVHYRPRVYWPAGTKVRLDVPLTGVDVGKGVWGLQDRTINFTVGSAQISKVNAKTHTMTVYRDGRKLRTFPVSTGREKYPTSSGAHVIMEKAAVYHMDSSTIGIPRGAPGGYFLKVLWSLRISNSGEFVHSAPWSVRSQGRANVSHGCINVAPKNAEWFFKLSRRGDVVEVTGTKRKLEKGNGFADWAVPWSEWVAGSALD